MRNSWMKWSIATIGALILCGGCAQNPPINAWYTTTQPVTDTARLNESSDVYCQMINIYYPGSEPPRTFLGTEKRSFLLLPGRTRLQVAYYRADSTGKDWTGVSKVVEFDAKPGHTYHFKTFLPAIRLDWFRNYAENEWDVQVIDSDAEKVVVETKGRG